MRNRIIKLGLICLTTVAVACLAVRLLAPAWFGFPTYASVETICPGDVNHDEQRDIRDVIAIQAHILEKKTLPGDLQVVADVNQDNSVDVLDIVRLIQHIIGRKPLVDCKGTMAVSPSNLNFGDVRAGTSKELNLGVKNSGNAKLSVTSITSDSTQFAAVSPATPFDVLPGVERAVTVRFSPSSVGSYSGSLTISATTGGTAMTAVVSVAGAGLTAANPSPTMTGLSPASATAGDSGLNLILTGTNFFAGSQVLWDGSPRTTTFVSATEVRAAIPASDLTQADVVGVTVVNAPPGGGQTAVRLFTINPRPDLPASGPMIRYLAPTKGLASGRFTLQGKGFGSSVASNRVVFFIPGSEVQATLVSANETTIAGNIPTTLQSKTYGVKVTVNQKTSNAVSYEVTTTPAALSLYPSQAFLLLPPGSGKEFLLLGGGTPPYKLRPLAADQQTAARAELRGNVVEVTGLDPGQYSKDVTITVEDSATNPAVVISTVRVQRPDFTPDFEVAWPTLLAGSSPGFTIRVLTSYGQMRLRNLKIKLHGLGLDLSPVEEGSLLALAEQEGDHQILQITSKTSTPGPALTYQGIRRFEKSFETIAEGEVEILPSSSPVMVLRDYPAPVPEAVNASGIDYQIFVRDQVFKLPTEANRDFTVTAAFTSVTVLDGIELPMIRTVTKTFRTTSLAAGAPAIMRVLPARAEIGRPIQMFGSGFDPVAGNNHVTFAAAGGKRVEAELISASAEKLVVYVPSDAETGSVKVAVGSSLSNAYDFTVLFRPFGAIAIENQTANALRAPELVFGQPYDVVGFGSLEAVFGRGQLDVSQLVKDQQAGSVQVGSDYQYVLIYGGQEPDGLRRHFFDMKRNGQSTEVTAKVYVFGNSGGEGLTIQLIPVESFDVAGTTGVVTFDKPFYRLPSAGTQVDIVISIRSAAWCFLPGTELEAIFGQRMNPQ